MRIYVTADVGEKHDILGPVSGGRAGNDSQIREVRCNHRGNGRGVVTRFHEQLISQGLETPNSQLRERGS